MSGILLGVVGSTFSSPPVNTVAPAVTGTASVGETLTSSTGTWTGAGITYTYQWQHTTTNISGATSSTYVIEVAYLAETIRCVVTATNSAGSSAANSNATSAVAAAAPTYLWAWGKNDLGQLGIGDAVSRSSPVQIGALSTWAQVSGGHGGNFTHAVKADGTLWAWGSGLAGVSGLGNTIDNSSPVQVGALTNWTGSLMPSSATNSACYVKSNGQAWFFGNIGKFFDNAFGATNSSPVQVASDKSWLTTATHPKPAWFGVTTAGALWSFCAYNQFGLSGQTNTTNTSSPAQVGALTNWAGVYPGTETVIARKTDGTLWSWGKAYPANPKAQMGQNDGVYRSSPTQIGALTNWARVSVGRYACVAVKTDGTLWTWGYNGNGALGLGDAINRSSPTQVGALTNWATTADKNVMAGSPGCIAVKTDGSLWSWGRAYWGVLGQNTAGGTAVNKSSPTQVGSLTTWTKVGSNYNSGFAISNHAT